MYYKINAFKKDFDDDSENQDVFQSATKIMR